MASSNSKPCPGSLSPSKPLRRWARRLFMGMLTLLILLMAGGGIYQALGQHSDARRYTAPGRWVDVGGYKLHLYSSGAGTVPVVLVAANGGGVLDWYKVQPELARFTQVVSYDRAGMGWSEPGPGPRSSAQIVQELHTLLNKAGIRAPYVLVGHSLGGLHVQLYAMQYPEEVAGLVLVDASHAEMAGRDGFVPSAFAMPALVRVVGSLGVVRLLNQVNDWSNGRRPNDFGPTFRADLEHEASMLYSHTEDLVAMAREFASLPTSSAQVRAANLQLGDKPLFVLTRSGEANPSPRRLAMETLWRGWQADLAGRSRDVQHVVADQGGHYLQQDQPDLVVKAVLQTVEAASRMARPNLENRR